MRNSDLLKKFIDDPALALPLYECLRECVNALNDYIPKLESKTGGSLHYGRKVVADAKRALIWVED